MLAFDDIGTGPAVLLIHGTPSSRKEWTAVLPALAEHRRVIAIDLPGFGQSAPIAGANLPAQWAPEIRATLQALGIDRVSVVGNSMGGWMALELARIGLAHAVLAFSAAGLWRRHPLGTDLRILQGQLAGKLAPRFVFERALANPRQRRRALKDISVDAGRIPAEVVIESLHDVTNAPGWWPHYRAARHTRFMHGQQIDPTIAVRIIFGDQDRIARARTSRHVDQLPAHAIIQTWPDCGHMVIWDARDKALEAILSLPG